MRSCIDAIKNYDKGTMFLYNAIEIFVILWQHIPFVLNNSHLIHLILNNAKKCFVISKK